MTLQRILIGLFVVLAVALGSLWFVNNFELKETEEQIGFQGEAKTNHLLAARLFLKRMGIPAERKDTLTTLPTSNSVLIIDTERFTLSRQKIKALLDWVEQGGHLITRARTPTDAAETDNEEATSTPTTLQSDLLQQALGISIGNYILPDDADLPLQVKLPGMRTSLEVDPNFFYALHAEKKTITQATYHRNDWLVEQRHGKGRVTLVSNLDFIGNSFIKDYDHAEFLWYLVHSQYKTPPSVWLVHQDDMPALWQLIWEHAWPLVLTLAAFLPLTLLALAPRFGPLLPAPIPERRRILEHIQASGLFMWKRFTKYHDLQYQTFINKVNQLYPGIRKQHDK